MAALPFLDVLRGMPLPHAVEWPPPSLEAAEHMETWMRVTADGAREALVASQALEGVDHVLDVGGGDGTIPCQLADAHPDLKTTIFNLPASSYLARRTIAERGCGDRVNVIEGDFNKDELPGGYDCLLFSRVLTDWSADVCRALLEKARRALRPDGKLVICEAFVEGNRDYALAWEFRYIFYDTFGRALFKPLATYRRLLQETGFRVAKVHPMTDRSFYTVVEAVPDEQTSGAAP